MAHRSTRKTSPRPAFGAAVKALTASSLALGATLSLSPLASAANVEDYWTGTTGNFDDATWSLGSSPNTQSQVNGNYTNGDVFNGGTVNITGTDRTNDFNLGGSNAGALGNGTANMTAGTFNVGIGGGWMRLGTTTTTSGTFNMSGGVLNFGTLTADGATTFQGNGGNQFNIGEQANTTGVVNLTGGTLNAFNGGSEVSIGQGGTGSATAPNGTFNQGPGSTFNVNGQLWVGQGTASVGVYNMTGGNLNVHNWLAIGRNTTGVGSGTFNFSGGTITKDNVYTATSAAGVTSTVNTGSHLTTSGNGTFNMTGGFLNNVAGGGAIWISEGGASNYNISGGSIFAGDGIVVAGANGATGGSGTLYLQGATGATGGLTNGGGTEVVTSPTVTFNNAPATNTAVNSTVLLEGGTLITNGFAAGTGGGSKNLYFDGGTVRASANNGAFFGGTTVTAAFFANPNGATLPSATIDTNGFNVTVATAITSLDGADGGLVKAGQAVLTLSGANSYTGNTAINAGLLDAQTTSSLPGYPASGSTGSTGKISIANGAGLGLGIGGTNGYTIADFDNLRAGLTVPLPTGSVVFGFDTQPTQNAAAAGTTSTTTYTSNITNGNGTTTSGTVGFSKLGAGTLVLTGNNTYTGTTYFGGGLLSAGTNNLGNGGALVFNGGGLQFGTGNTTDYTARGVSVLSGGATFDTNGNTVNFANAVPFAANATLTKLGTGNLTFNGITTPTTTPATTLGNLFVRGGSLTFTGATAVFNGGGNYMSTGQQPGDFGTLNVANGASYVTTGDFNVADVGGVVGSTTAGISAANDGGVLNISGTGTTVAGGSIFIGKGGAATVANATTTNANGAAVVGVVNQTGGTLTGTQNAQIGAYGQGQYNLSGGTFTHTGGFVSIGRQAGAFGKLDVSGTGVVNDTAAGTRFIVGELGTGVLTVRNGGVVNINNTTNATGGTLSSALAALTLGNGPITANNVTTPGGTGIVNLLTGGTINTLSVGGNNAASGAGILNFNGGTLANNAASPTFIQNLTQANVFAGGATINTAAGNATIAQPLIAPAGNGVTAITGTTGTGTFASAPIVQITGGGGTGATALATLDANGNISGYTITSPGTGYTTAPTVTISGASGTTYTASTTLGENTSGGLTKTGANILTLTAANTYTGPTFITGGTLALTGTGNIAASPLVNTTGGTFNVSGVTTTGGYTFGTGRTLTGTGTLAGGALALTINGIVAPGATQAVGSIGTLALNTTGTLTLAGTVQYDINSPTNKDLITAANANLTVSGTLAVSGTVATGTTYTLVSGLAAENGNFSSVTVNGQTVAATFSTSGAAGNLNYNVTFGAVPEPSTWALGVFGLGGMAAVWMRRRRVA